MPPIRAVMVTPNLTLGGAERWVVDLIKHSDPKKLFWQSCVLSSFGGCDTALSHELAKYTCIYSNSDQGKRPSHAQPFDWSAIRYRTHHDFRETVKWGTMGADVIVTWGQPNMEKWLSRMVNQDIPRVIVSHCTLPEKVVRPITGITHLTGVSEKALVDYFSCRDGYADLPKQVIWNGADTNRCKPFASREAMRDDWNIPHDAYVVGYLGRCGSEKNPLAAAKAVKELPEDYYAVYCGPEPSGKDVNVLDWCEHHIPGRYHHQPSTQYIGSVLNAFDVVMLASHREAFSLVLLESWFAGVPVIATPVGSVPEVEDQFGGMTISVPCNPSTDYLANAVLFSRRLGVRTSLNERVSIVAQHNFTVQHMVQRWTSYLERVVQDG